MPIFWAMIFWTVWRDWLDPSKEEVKGQEGNIIHVDFKKRRRA